MNTLLNQQLVQIKVQEMMQEAAESRADRKERMAHPSPVARKLRFTLAAAVPLVLWVVWVFVAD
jgi:hypothetical protein